MCPATKLTGAVQLQSAFHRWGALEQPKAKVCRARRAEHDISFVCLLPRKTLWSLALCGGVRLSPLRAVDSSLFFRRVGDTSGKLCSAQAPGDASSSFSMAVSCPEARSEKRGSAGVSACRLVSSLARFLFLPRRYEQSIKSCRSVWAVRLLDSSPSPFLPNPFPTPLLCATPAQTLDDPTWLPSPIPSTPLSSSLVSRRTSPSCTSHTLPRHKPVAVH